MPDHAYIAFLDILGYKDLLEVDVKSGTFIFRDKMIKAFRCFDEVDQSKYSYKAISDSIFICCTEREQATELLFLLAKVFNAFLEEGLLVRGGVSFGQHFQNQTITYSPVLTKAYFLESKVAEFPRVMVDSNIVEMFPNLEKEGIIHRTGKNWFLRITTKDSFAGTWAAAKKTFMENRSAIAASERIRIKHRWLQDYLLEFAKSQKIRSPKSYIRIFD